MMKKRTLWVAVLCFMLCVAVLCGCSPATRSAAPEYNAPSADSSFYYLQYSRSDEALKVADSGSMTADRKIIRSVDETVETTKFDDFMADLDKAVAEAGGYFGSARVSGNCYGDDSKRSAHLTAYIPAEKLDEFSDRVGTLGAVTDFREYTNDVTEAYVDTESRIAVLEAEETSLLSMLESAKSVPDMLAVRDQLTDVQQDLASLRAQKTSYDKRIAYSTVDLTVYEVDYVSGASRVPFFTEVADTFSDSLFGVLNFLRGVGVVLLGGLPIIVLVGGVGCGLFFIFRAIHRKQEKRRLAQKEQK